ncbi:MAG TPA: hypothetical protein EYP30_06340 [Archaeoglobaceae archaeon]|nr:hypothetical protein [Archaeoglobaceae archaeon]
MDAYIYKRLDDIVKDSSDLNLTKSECIYERDPCFKERQMTIHIFREVNYKLWEHGVNLKTRKEYVNEVKKILLSLKNSLEKECLEEKI